MKQLARISAALLISILPLCSAQTAHKKKAAPKPEPTAAELFEYIRGAMLSLSPEDGINDNLAVTFNPATSIMTVTQPGGGHCDEVFNALNPNYIVWDAFDPSDSGQTREKLVRLTMVSMSGKTARTCYDKANQIDTTVPSNRVRLLFSYSKAEQVTNFEENMTKAVQKLIVLTGGAPVQTLF